MVVSTEMYSYDIYGTPTITNSAGTTLTASAYGNRYLFSGREYESTTGLYHYRNRDYSPTLGRFLEPDPTGHSGDGYNLYRFCSNDPVNYSDPSGLDTQQPIVVTPPEGLSGPDQVKWQQNSNAPGGGAGEGGSTGNLGTPSTNSAPANGTLQTIIVTASADADDTTTDITNLYTGFGTMSTIVVRASSASVSTTGINNTDNQFRGNIGFDADALHPGAFIYHFTGGLAHGVSGGIDKAFGLIFSGGGLILKVAGLSPARQEIAEAASTLLESTPGADNILDQISDEFDAYGDVNEEAGTDYWVQAVNDVSGFVYETPY